VKNENEEIELPRRKDEVAKESEITQKQIPKSREESPNRESTLPDELRTNLSKQENKFIPIEEIESLFIEEPVEEPNRLPKKKEEALTNNMSQSNIPQPAKPFPLQQEQPPIEPPLAPVIEPASNVNVIEEVSNTPVNDPVIEKPSATLEPKPDAQLSPKLVVEEAPKIAKEGGNPFLGFLILLIIIAIFLFSFYFLVKEDIIKLPDNINLPFINDKSPEDNNTNDNDDNNTQEIVISGHYAEEDPKVCPEVPVFIKFYDDNTYEFNQLRLDEDDDEIACKGIILSGSYSINNNTITLNSKDGIIYATYNNDIIEMIVDDVSVALTKQDEE